MTDQITQKPTFQLVNRLVLISAFYRVEAKVFDIPSRDDGTMHARNFWSQWDSVFPILDELVRRKRETGEAIESTPLWSLTKQTIKDIFKEKYEFCREVVIDQHDFNGLCTAITVENTIHIGPYIFKPIGEDFYTDDYGNDQFGTVWGYSMCGKGVVQIDRTTDWELAKKVYFLVNDAYPTVEQYGEEAEHLDRMSWSIYDTAYIPLKDRVAQGYGI